MTVLFLQGLQCGCCEQSNTVLLLCAGKFALSRELGSGHWCGLRAQIAGTEGSAVLPWKPAIKDLILLKVLGFFFNLHFLNYSKSRQVHIHNRKVTNCAVVLKTRSADAVKLILKLFSGGKEEVDWIICSQPCALKVAGMMPLQGEKQIKLYTRDLAVQAVLWNLMHSKVWDPS